MREQISKQGRLITFEGIEGAGKSTHIQYASKIFTQLNIKHAITREPGGTRLGEAVRSLLVDIKNSNMHPMTELLLIFAARQQHIAEVIQPYLQDGYWVLCDRFVDASYAYQGGGRKTDKHMIKLLDSWVVNQLTIDITFYFDIDVETSAQRLRDKTIDRFETEGSEFMQRVRNAYLQRISEDINRFILIDATQSITNVQQMVKIALLKYIHSL